MLNIRSSLHVMNDVSMGTNMVGADTSCGGPIKLTIPVKEAVLLNGGKAVNAIEVEINRADLLEFIVRTNGIIGMNFDNNDAVPAK